MKSLWLLGSGGENEMDKSIITSLILSFVMLSGFPQVGTLILIRLLVEYLES